jgi:SAM-dependent methyltransferase
VIALYRTPYGWQHNNTTRAFEYPWAYEQVDRLGAGRTVVDLGGSMTGIQFSLAAAGHHVVNVDPGMAARGKGWPLDAEGHGRLSECYRAPVTLVPETLPKARLEENSVDVLLSISTLEHLTPSDLDELVAEVPRILRPGGHAVLTVDLFLDLEPFTARKHNEYGVNIDVSRLLETLGLELELGNRGELNGFPEFDPDRVQSALGSYLIGVYPVLAQCLVARRAPK